VTDDDLAGLADRDLLELVVRELRALRRLIGSIFVVSVLLIAVAVVIGAVG